MKEEQQKDTEGGLTGADGVQPEGAGNVIFKPKLGFSRSEFSPCFKISK